MCVCLCVCVCVYCFCVMMMADGCYLQSKTPCRNHHSENGGMGRQFVLEEY